MLITSSAMAPARERGGCQQRDVGGCGCAEKNATAATAAIQPAWVEAAPPLHPQGCGARGRNFPPRPLNARRSTHQPAVLWFKGRECTRHPLHDAGNLGVSCEPNALSAQTGARPGQ